MRLFAAIDLTDDARVAIAAEQQHVVSRFGEASRSLRLVRPEHMHLTLFFVGDVTESAGAVIVKAMSGGIDQRPFPLSFGGLGVFPPRGHPRALFLGIANGEMDVIGLQERIARRLLAAGAEPERRPFLPHLTLARWRKSRSSDRRLVRIDHDGVVASVDVAEVMLYESRLSSKGPAYTGLAHAPLT